MVKIFGEENEDFGRLALLALPCNFGLEPGEIPEDNPECITDLEEQKNFLSPLNYITVYNQERVDMENFS